MHDIKNDFPNSSYIEKFDCKFLSLNSKLLIKSQRAVKSSELPHKEKDQLSSELNVSYVQWNLFIMDTSRPQFLLVKQRFSFLEVIFWLTRRDLILCP